MNRREIKNECALIYIEDDIIYAIFDENIHLNLTEAKQLVFDRKKISSNTESCIFIDASKVKGITKEARDFFGSNEASEFIKATAIYKLSFDYLFSKFCSKCKPVKNNCST